MKMYIVTLNHGDSNSDHEWVVVADNEEQVYDRMALNPPAVRWWLKETNDDYNKFINIYNGYQVLNLHNRVVFQ